MLLTATMVEMIAMQGERIMAHNSLQVERIILPVTLWDNVLGGIYFLLLSTTGVHES